MAARGDSLFPGRAAAILAASSIALAGVCAAQAGTSSDLLRSQARAAALLERSIAAHGGAERAGLARTFDLTATLENQRVHQSPDPEPPFGTWSVKARYVSDPERDRFFFESDVQFPSFRNFTRTVSTKGDGWLIDFLAKTKVPETNLSGAQSLMARLLPQNLLLEARRRGATLRWVGESTDAGRRLQAISYVRPSGELYTLSFDGETHLLAGLEALQANTLDGDVVFRHAYGGYRDVAGLKVPSRYEIRRGPWSVTKATITKLEIGAVSNDGDFAVPADYRRIESYDPAMRMETIAPGVHVVRYVPDGYNVLCVEFADHLAVVETPEGNSRAGLSEQVIAFIEQSLPGKPIRYAVPTHHHSDHVGGVRGYVAEGATIVSTRGNQALLTQLAARRSSIAPDALDKSAAAPKLEFLSGETMVLQDETQELRLYRIGPTPHVNDILIVYLPKEKILFQTDLFNAWSCFKSPVPNEDIGHTTALGDTQALIAAVERLGLQVDRVVGGHGRDVEWAWMKAYTARRAADGLPMWACGVEEMR